MLLTRPCLLPLHPGELGWGLQGQVQFSLAHLPHLLVFHTLILACHVIMANRRGRPCTLLAVSLLIVHCA